MSRRLIPRSALALLALVWAACDGSPAAPRTITLKLPNFNTPPVIRSVTAATSTVARTEVNQDITVTAVVEDKETAIPKLTFLWSATAGTVTGTGPVVTWRLTPGAVKTPVDVTITLVIVEPFEDVDSQGQPVPKENRVTQSAAPFTVHDSVAELTKMTTDFLVVYFGNSNVSATDAVVDFSNNCPGKCDEWGDVVDNRAQFRIVSAEAHVESIVFDGPNFAEITAPTLIHDIILDGNAAHTADFRDLLTAVFEGGRWWLCSSSSDHASSINEMLRRGIPGLLPSPRSADRSKCPFLIPSAQGASRPPVGRGAISHRGLQP